jgi:hypothetical protein
METRPHRNVSPGSEERQLHRVTRSPSRAVHLAAPPAVRRGTRRLSLDADQGDQPGHFAREAGGVGRIDNGTHVLVGARRLFRDTTRRGTLDDDPARGQLVDRAAGRVLAAC